MNEWQIRTVDNLVAKGGRIVVIMPEESAFEPVVPIGTYNGSRTIYQRNAYILGEKATDTRVVNNTSVYEKSAVPAHSFKSWETVRREMETMTLAKALFKELDK